MSGEDRLSAAAFRAVCLGCAAILLVLALFCRIRLVRTKAEIEELRAALDEAKKQQVLLTAERERSLSLDRLERWATLEHGMRHPEAGQIVRIEAAG